MKAIAWWVLLFVAAPLSALAQSVPNGPISQGEVWTAAQWNSAWQSKVDYPLALPSDVVTFTGTITPNDCAKWIATGVLEDSGGTCGSGGGGSSAFNSLTSGTNTSATMLVGSGASLAPTGTGTVTASGLTSTALAAPPAIGGTTPAAGAFSSLTDAGVTGSTQCLQANSAGLITGTGSACGSGGGGSGTVNSGTSGQLAYYGSTGTAVSGLNVGTNLAISGTTLGFSQGLNAQTGTSYAMQTTDAGKLVTFSNASAVAVTLSQATTTGFTAGYSFDVENLGAGLVTITPATSTINGLSSFTVPTNMGCTISSDGTNYQVSACTAALSSVLSLNVCQFATNPAKCGTTIKEYGSVACTAGSNVYTITESLPQSYIGAYATIGGCGAYSAQQTTSTTSALDGFTNLQGYAPNSTGGSGYVPNNPLTATGGDTPNGDVLTVTTTTGLTCSTFPQLQVLATESGITFGTSSTWSNAAGAVGAMAVTRGGVCSAIPANPATVNLTGGTGTGIGTVTVQFQGAPVSGYITAISGNTITLKTLPSGGSAVNAVATVSSGSNWWLAGFDDLAMFNAVVASGASSFYMPTPQATSYGKPQFGISGTLTLPSTYRFFMDCKGNPINALAPIAGPMITSAGSSGLNWAAQGVGYANCRFDAFGIAQNNDLRADAGWLMSNNGFFNATNANISLTNATYHVQHTQYLGGFIHNDLTLVPVPPANAFIDANNNTDNMLVDFIIDGTQSSAIEAAGSNLNAQSIHAFYNFNGPTIDFQATKSICNQCTVDQPQAGWQAFNFFSFNNGISDWHAWLNNGMWAYQYGVTVNKTNSASHIGCGGGGLNNPWNLQSGNVIAFGVSNGSSSPTLIAPCIQGTGVTGEPLYTSSLTISGGLNSTAVGNTTASTGAFTTLSASSTVSGTGFSTYLASPPAIGSTTPGTGAFTTATVTTSLKATASGNLILGNVNDGNGVSIVDCGGACVNTIQLVGGKSGTGPIIKQSSTGGGQADLNMSLNAPNAGASSNLNGGAVALNPGNGDTAGAGGAINLPAGQGGATGVGGNVNITAGPGGSSSGNGGNVAINGGTVTSGTAGAVNVQVAGAGATNIETGASTGAVHIDDGSGTGNVTIGNSANQTNLNSSAVSVAGTLSATGASALTGVTNAAAQSAGNIGEVVYVNCPVNSSTLAVTGVAISAASPAVVTWPSTLPAVESGPTNWTCPVYLTSIQTGGAVTGISAPNQYWIVGSSVSGNTFTLASSDANALAGTTVGGGGTAISSATMSFGQQVSASSTATSGAEMNISAGDWLCNGNGNFDSNATSTATTQFQTGLNTSVVLRPSTGLKNMNYNNIGIISGTWGSGVVQGVTLSGAIENLTAGNTLFLVDSVVSTGTPTAFYVGGGFECLRVH
jgi:hypothetical protein